MMQAAVTEEAGVEAHERPKEERLAAWGMATIAAALFAVDPVGLRGAVVRARSGPVRDRWLAHLKDLLPPDDPLAKLPPGIGDDRLLGGLDLAATLKAGKPVAETGLLARVHGGVLLMPMAERAQAVTVAHLAAALDHGEVLLERDGLTRRIPARLGIVAFDEGVDADERPPAALTERLAFPVDLAGLSVGDTQDTLVSPQMVADARVRLTSVVVEDATLKALCETAHAFGIGSLRAPSLAIAAARASAALEGRDTVSEEDAILATRLVLGPRATQLPAAPEQEQPEESEADPPPPEDQAPEEEQDQPPPEDSSESEEDDQAALQSLENLLIEAAKASLPSDLLARLALAVQTPSQPGGVGKSGAVMKSMRRGRPAGTRRGEPGGGVRMNVVETLRAAAPWQPLRRRAAGEEVAPGTRSRVRVHAEDFRITRFKHRMETITIFAVDASGSSALNRLAEAKGAVELLLADCYVRRDEVAVIAFRGDAAEIVLPPTRSLVRAKRSLAGLPGGGGTPLVAGLDAAFNLALAARRKGQSPVVILLTDGRGNIARDGTADRKQASADATASARLFRAEGIAAIMVDTSPRRHPDTERLAAEMGARYLPLPRADAAMLSKVAKDMAGGSGS